MGAWLGTVVAAVIGVAVAMFGLGLGLLLARPPLRGSCGGTGGPCLCDPGQRTCEAFGEPT